SRTVFAPNALLTPVKAIAACWASSADGARACREIWVRSVPPDAVPVMSRSATAASLLEKSLSGGICVCRKLYMIVTRNIRRTQYRMAKRSEEHTSELQSRFDVVCRLLLERKATLLSSIITYFISCSHYNHANVF